MSSSDDEDDSSLESEIGNRLSFNPKLAVRPKNNAHEMTREHKALISRRFDNYFAAKRIYSDDFWKQSDKRNYDPKKWVKLIFDGQVKRCNTLPL